LKRSNNGSRLIGRSLEGLSILDRADFAGTWVALELYTPATIPLRVIEAAAASAEECARQLSARGLRPTDFEYLPITPQF
jgi:hypothetical protein